MNIHVDRDVLVQAIIYHSGQAVRGGCISGCELPLGASLAEHAVDVAPGADRVVHPEITRRERRAGAQGATSRPISDASSS